MKLNYVVVGLLETNCYICSNSKKEAIVIDPGFEPGKILNEIKKDNLDVKFIILTHGHFDHINAVSEVKEVYSDAKIYIHEKDIEWYKRGKQIAKDSFGITFADMSMPDTKDLEYMKEGDVIKLDEISLKVMHTPGHSAGCVSLIDEDDKIVFSGDTLFNGAIGRTDLIGGSSSDILISIKEKLFRLDGDYKVYPGHGSFTTIGEEKKHNPYISDKIL
jgi:hydroxyacylglutathione hydrolase